MCDNCTGSRQVSVEGRNGYAETLGYVLGSDINRFQHRLGSGDIIVLHHDRRRIMYFDVTVHPTAIWIKQQITEAFPWDTAPSYLIRDRDSAYGNIVSARIEALDIEEVVTAPRSPWQNPFVERVIGSIRREYLDHVIIFNEDHLRRILVSYLDYYHRCRTHLSLDKDTPDRRSVQHADTGKIVAYPQVGGLHHRYERLAA